MGRFTNVFLDWWDDFGFAPTKLYWGCETNPCVIPTDGDGEPVPNKDRAISSLDVTSSNLAGYTSPGEVRGVNLLTGDTAITSTLVHNNNPIYGSSLLGATLSTKLFLTPAPLDATLNTGIPPLLFNIVFKETPNNGDDCSYFEDIEEGTSLPLCQNDIFVIDTFGTGGDFNPCENTFNQQFVGGDGYTYNIGLSVSGLDTLDDEVCARVGTGAAGCVGVTTFESQENSFDVSMKITVLSEPRVISEPSTILLMSLALFGFVTYLRNQKP